MRHTKGEWFASGLEVVVMPSQIKISNSISGAIYEEAKANAKLISAAPDLLTSLKTLEDFVTRCLTLEGKLTSSEIEMIVGHARKAISKAI